MDEAEYSREHIESRLRETEERFRLAQIASGIGWFEWDLATNEWQWTPYVAILFGFDPDVPKPSFSEWERAIFIDDVPKLHAAIERAAQTGAYYSEFRVRHPDGSSHWIAGKGEARKDGNGRAGLVSGVYYEISERKGSRRSSWRSTKLWKPVLPSFAKRRARWRCSTAPARPSPRSSVWSGSFRP
jgi:PAS domain S-box-containing protein